MLRATTACIFSTCELPKVVRTWRALYSLTWKRASRHNGVHFYDIATFKGAPKLRATAACNFSSLIWPDGSAPTALASLLFHPEPQINGKHSESRLSYLFAHLPLLSSFSFSSLICSLLFFSSLILPASAFASVHIVGSLTSKLPSTSFRTNQRAHIKAFWKSLAI